MTVPEFLSSCKAVAVRPSGRQHHPADLPGQFVVRLYEGEEVHFERSVDLGMNEPVALAF